VLNSGLGYVRALLYRPQSACFLPSSSVECVEQIAVLGRLDPEDVQRLRELCDQAAEERQAIASGKAHKRKRSKYGPIEAVPLEEQYQLNDLPVKFKTRKRHKQLTLYKLFGKSESY
jgi:hypothetical protein